MLEQPVYLIETYRGMEIKAMQDLNPEDPRECDGFGNMICFHKRYQLGDEHNMTVEEAKEGTRREDTIARPIYMLDHSGITIGTSPFGCPWDSGQVGWIYATHDEIKRDLGVSEITPGIEAQVVRMLESIIKEYDYFVRGDIWLVWVEDEDGDELDVPFGSWSCPVANVGPVGEDALAEARHWIDWELREREVLRQKRVKTLIRNRVPHWKRQELMAKM